MFSFFPSFYPKGMQIFALNCNALDKRFVKVAGKFIHHHVTRYPTLINFYTYQFQFDVLTDELHKGIIKFICLKIIINYFFICLQ